MRFSLCMRDMPHDYGEQTADPDENRMQRLAPGSVRMSGKRPWLRKPRSTNKKRGSVLLNASAGEMHRSP